MSCLANRCRRLLASAAAEMLRGGSVAPGAASTSGRCGSALLLLPGAHVRSHLRSFGSSHRAAELGRPPLGTEQTDASKGAKVDIASGILRQIAVRGSQAMRLSVWRGPHCKAAHRQAPHGWAARRRGGSRIVCETRRRGA